MKECQKYFKSAIEYDKSNLKARRQLADLQFGDRNYQEAFEQYRLLRNSTKALRCLDLQIHDKEDDHTLLVKKGQYHAEIFEFSDAIKSYN